MDVGTQISTKFQEKAHYPNHPLTEVHCPEGFSIVPLSSSPQHINTLAQWWYDSWAHETKETLPEISDFLDSTLGSDGCPKTFVAMHGDKPVGMISLLETDGLDMAEKPWLGSLYIDEDYRKKGLAKPLMQTVINHADELGLDKLYLWTLVPRLAEYYGSMGWDPYKIQKIPATGDPVTVMTKEVPDFIPDRKFS